MAEKIEVENTEKLKKYNVNELAELLYASWLASMIYDGEYILSENIEGAIKVLIETNEDLDASVKSWLLSLYDDIGNDPDEEGVQVQEDESC